MEPSWCRLFSLFTLPMRSHRELSASQTKNIASALYFLPVSVFAPPLPENIRTGFSCV